MEQNRRDFLKRGVATIFLNGINTKTNVFFSMNMDRIESKELRIILTVDNLDEVISFYRDALGMKVSKEWHNAEGNGIILDAGRASLELIDSDHARKIDLIEVGKRSAGPVRLAINVGDNIDAASAELERAGAISLAPVRQAPWSKVRRMKDPASLQFTLFETSTLFPDEK
jgi:catechol 2,3-dioxygenase-like lactoylglutathione lyase family enzyme